MSNRRPIATKDAATSAAAVEYVDKAKNACLRERLEYLPSQSETAGDDTPRESSLEGSRKRSVSWHLARKRVKLASADVVAWVKPAAAANTELTRHTWTTAGRTRRYPIPCGAHVAGDNAFRSPGN